LARSTCAVLRSSAILIGIHLVSGLDIAGDKLMEAKLFSPDRLGSAGSLYEVDFAAAEIEATERKTQIRASYGPSLPNEALVTL
jgi:hypothetical protein